MATIHLTDHEAIRSWAAARLGAPAIVDISPAGGTQPMLRIVFGQAAYQDQDRPERPQNAGGIELVEWDEWFGIFEQNQLALVVQDETAGSRDNYYEFAPRAQS